MGHHLQCECLTRRNHVSESGPASFRQLKVLTGSGNVEWIDGFLMDTRIVKCKFGGVAVMDIPHWECGWFIFVQVNKPIIIDLKGKKSLFEDTDNFCDVTILCPFFRLSNEQNLKNPISCQQCTGFEDSI